jgi:hypothetical protein
MHVRPRRLRKALEKILGKLRLEVADPRGGKSRLNNAKRPPAKIDGGCSKRFVHGHQEISGAQDSFFVSKRGSHCLTERNADILYGVVLIHVEITLRFNLQIETAVSRNQIQHVIEKPDAGVNIGFSSAIETQPHTYLRFFGVAL